ncbi:hypothetical protein IEQ34_004055 [Dendrobium chrysotoxum]|uniref:Uncharacterized protein n=1 Tax=Dendrobium chrysotoxum TaxID=161865 RepID=A0AAV7HG15_DENCH|nr:hypothetical protein IEQ34_004055 [Dendrobium chrysotoxum]
MYPFLSSDLNKLPSTVSSSNGPIPTIFTLSATDTIADASISSAVFEITSGFELCIEISVSSISNISRIKGVNTDALVAVKVVPVDRESCGGLDPEKEGRDAAFAGYFGSPRHEERVDYAGDGLAACCLIVNDGGEGSGTNLLAVVHGCSKVVNLRVEAVVIAVGIGDVSKEIVMEYSCFLVWEHAAVGVDGGGEGGLKICPKSQLVGQDRPGRSIDRPVRSVQIQLFQPGRLGSSGRSVEKVVHIVRYDAAIVRDD